MEQRNNILMKIINAMPYRYYNTIQTIIPELLILQFKDIKISLLSFRRSLLRRYVVITTLNAGGKKDLIAPIISCELRTVS